MARSRLRVLDSDGLDAVVSIDQDTPLADYPPELVSALKSPRGYGGFRGIVDVITRIAAQSPLVSNAAEVNTLSRAAHAYRLLWDLEILRRAVRAHPELEPVILAAVRLGYEWADMRWRFNRGSSTRTGVKRRVVSRKAGRESGKTRGNRNRPAIARMAQQLRDAHPYDRRHSTRWLAKETGRRMKLSEHTVRAAFRAEGRK